MKTKTGQFYESSEFRCLFHICNLCNFHLLFYWVHCDGSGLIQVFCDERLPLAAVCRCHRDSLQNAISPVDVAMDPVDGNALRSLNPTANYYSVVRVVTGHVDLGAVRMETKVR